MGVPASLAAVNRAAYFALCVLCVGIAATKVFELMRTASPRGADPRSVYHARLQPLREALAGIPYADYVGDAVAGFAGVPSDEATGLFFAQHHALPTILRRESGAPRVVANFHGADAAARVQALGLRIERELGGGLWLLAR
jgi:hypothetical protein